MCTLTGFLNFNVDNNSFNNYKDILNTMYKYVNIRGKDVYKCITINKKNEYDVQCSVGKKIDFTNVNINQTKALSIAARAIPAAEITNVGEENAQPFVVESKNEIYTLSHNGLISNDKELLKTFCPKAIEDQVDTKTTAMYFSVNGVSTKIINSIEGSFAFSIIRYMKNKTYNKYILYLCTNFMPLFYIKLNNIIFWASDPCLLEQDYVPIKEVKPYTLMTFTYEKDSVKCKVENLQNLLNSKKVLVICSGGMDSTTTALLFHYLKYDVSLIHFKYGQAAMKEEEWAVKRLSKKYKMPLYIVDVIDLFKTISVPSLLLTQTKADKKLRHKDMESTLSYVGARNLIFTSLAMGIAEKNKIGTIGLGLNLDDSSYPDNNIGFLRTLTNISPYALNWNCKLEVLAPFVHLTKKEILEIAISLDLDMLKNHVSCYYPKIVKNKIVYCGECGCCNLRENAFKALKIIDPVKYKTKPIWNKNSIYINDYDKNKNNVFKYFKRISCALDANKDYNKI